MKGRLNKKICAIMTSLVLVLGTFALVLPYQEAEAQGTITNVGLAVFGEPLIDGDLVVFRVRESAQGLGGTDLNGDGDTSDSVLHVFDSSTSTTTNVGFAAFNILIDGNLVDF